MGSSSNAGENVSGHARLLVRLVGCEDREVEVGSGLTIGRDAQSGLTLDHASVSRFHAEILGDAGEGYRIEDRESLNGTFVNGQRLSCARDLFHADEIRIGESWLRFLDPEGRVRPDVAGASWQGMQGEIDWEAPDVERCCAVVLSCDIRGCAVLAQKVPAADLQEHVAEWSEAARALLVRGGARPDGIERDRLLVYWPIEHADAPGPEVNAALRAATALRALAREYAERFSERFETGPFEVTAGLHLGDVSVARLADTAGSGIAGPIVGLADRLGTLEPGDGSILVTSWQVAQWAEPEFRFRNLCEIPAHEDQPALKALALARSESSPAS